MQDSDAIRNGIVNYLLELVIIAGGTDVMFQLLCFIQSTEGT